MPVAGHAKVCLGFLLRRRRKTTNWIDNGIHVTAEAILVPTNILRFRDSGKDCNFQAFCDFGKGYSAILARRGKKNRRKDILEGASTLCIELNCENRPFSPLTS